MLPASFGRLASTRPEPVGSTDPGRRGWALPARLLGTLALGVAFSLAGCSGAAGPSGPAVTPADFEGVVAELDRQHVAVSDVVSGDAGCPDPSLAPTAISLTASGLDQPTPVRVHLYLFRDRAAYDRLRPAIDTCARSYVTDPDAYVALDAPPLVATSAGPWAPGLTTAVRTALTRAAGG